MGLWHGDTSSHPGGGGATGQAEPPGLPAAAFIGIHAVAPGGSHR